MSIRKIKLPDNTTVDINDSRVHIYRSLTGTAAVTSSPYYCSRWDVTDETITSYEDGMVVCVKVPVAGNGNYGTALQINSLGYKPIVYNVSSMISTRYNVGSVVWATYNSTQTATLYLGSGSQTITGCWQVMDYDANSLIYNTTHYYNYKQSISSASRYVLVAQNRNNQLVPFHAGSSSTGTSKTMTTESFDPFQAIYYYTTNTDISQGGTFAANTLYTMLYNVDARYCFNCAKTLTSGRPLYLVVDLQSDGQVKLATSPTNPWSQALPSTNDGHMYILLGYTYSTYQFNLIDEHPIYYHDGTQIRQYSGDATGSGNVQPDWTQNDSTADDYVKNRTHWEEDPVVTNHDILDLNATSNVTTANGVRRIRFYGNSNYDYFGFLDIFNVPEITVNVNGHQFNLDAYDDYGWGDDRISSLYDEGQESGVVLEDDMCWVKNWSDWELERDFLDIYVPDSVVGSGVNSLTITTIQGGSVHQIPEKFIPYKQADWEQGDATEPDYIKNKPNFVSNIINEYGYIESGDLYLSDNVLDSAYYDTSGYTTNYFFLYIPNDITLSSGYHYVYYLSGNSADPDIYIQNAITLLAGIYRCRLNDGDFEYIIINHDFTHTANTTVSTSTTTITYAANTRGSQMITVSADVGITFAVNNTSDNYLWIKNSGNAEIDVTISAVTHNSSNVSNVYVPSDGITVPASGVCEIGIICNADGAFITSRSDLGL